MFAALGILISLFFLWVSFRSLDPELVLANIGKANGGLLLLAAGVYFSALAAISYRWYFVLRSVRNIPGLRLMPLVIICYMGNNIYPFRTGEILRIFLLQRDHAVPFARSTATVFVERIFDGLTMIGFVLIGLLFVDVQSIPVRTVATIGAPLFLIALILFWVLASQPILMRWTAGLFTRPLPGKLREVVLHLTEDVIQGMGALRTPADVLGAAILSILSWMIEAGVYWLVAFAFGFNLSYPVMLLTVGAVNLAGLIPSSPGQIGVYEFFVSTVLMAVGIANAEAKAYALVVHMVIWLPVTLFGAFLLLRRGLSPTMLARANSLESEMAS